jgi:dipeptidyl aminopeptidase/acylaminoacyl peptidase
VSANFDQNSNTDIFLVSTEKLAKPIQLTYYKGADHKPIFSPDHTKIAFLRSSSEDAYDMYDLQQLGIIDIASKTDKVITKTYDLSIDNITWSVDGKFIFATSEEDRKQNIIQINASTGLVNALTNELGVYNSLHMNEKGKMAVLFSTPNVPNEVYLNEGAGFKQLTHVQDAFVNSIQKIVVKGFSAIASDNNKVNGILYLPDSNAKKLPLILFIHGGPVAQDEYSFDLTRQIYAAAGYAVAAVNYRGSSGRGANYTKCIYGDWGNKEVKDIIGVANYLIETGVADENKMAIAGWSYGGILTNYTIATDKRFKAAVSGAGSSLMLSFYGTDQYISQYEPELGKPWENLQKWLDVSYPFFKVKEIKTPTLFMASQADFNVPVVGAEQMYQAFKSVGIPTQLIIYPNQNHGIRVPSYLVHRYNSHLEWFKKYLN